MCGYFVIYWRNADMDFMVVYNAFVLNDGAKRTFFDHPGYLTILSVEAWFRLLHQLHLLDAWTLSAIPPGSNEAAFDLAMTSAVRAARMVAGLTAGALVLTFAWLARHIVMDRRVAICGIFVFALSGGVQMHLRILRTEMIAGCFCIFALMILIIAGRRGSLLRPLMLAAAAGLCVLGLENKVHVILLILAIPALVLPFGTSESASISFWNGGVRSLVGERRGGGNSLPGFCCSLAVDFRGSRPDRRGRSRSEATFARKIWDLSNRAARLDRRLHAGVCSHLAG